MLYAFNVELTLVVCGFQMCCSMENRICTRNTAQHSFTARADYFRSVQLQTCVKLHVANKLSQTNSPTV